MRQTHLFLFLLVLSLGGCDSNKLERSFPHSENWRLATIGEVKHPQVVPDSVNVVAYVVQKFICPTDANCWVGASMTLSEKNQSDNVDWDVSINLNYVDEMRVNRRYLFSIKILPTDYPAPDRRLKLIGYDEL